MNNPLYLRAFVDSPENLDPANEFANLLATHLQDIVEINIKSIERYYKITELVEVFVIFSYINLDEKILDTFEKILDKLGDEWIDRQLPRSLLLFGLKMKAILFS
jgi:hypothetical protein